VIHGTAEIIDTDPLRAELSTDVLARIANTHRANPTSLVPTLDERSAPSFESRLRRCCSVSIQRLTDWASAARPALSFAVCADLIADFLRGGVIALGE